MNSSEAMSIMQVGLCDALIHEGKRPPMRFIVWKKVGRNSVEAGRFLYRELAEAFMFCQKELYKSMRFQITNVGEYPVWN